MEVLFIKICICSACFGWCYVDKLTANYGLLDFLPQYYPRKLESLLNCSYCVAGWVSILSVIAFSYLFLWWSFLYVFTAPSCTMALVGIIKHFNTFYIDIKRGN